MEIAYKINQDLWYIRQIPYVESVEKIYIEQHENYEHYIENPIWKKKWIKQKGILAEIMIDGDGVTYSFEQEDDFISLNEKNTYIFNLEEDADKKLIELIR